MIIWIEKPLLMLLHDRQIAEHGGLGGVRDENLLLSALARPQQLHAYGDPPPDLADLAASLAHGIAKNHAFVDGNKRSAIVACETFLELNGATLDASDAAIYPAILGLANSQLSEAEFAGWLRAHLKLDASDGVQEPRAAYARKPRKKSAKRRAAASSRSAATPPAPGTSRRRTPRA